MALGSALAGLAKAIGKGSAPIAEEAMGKGISSIKKLPPVKYIENRIWEGVYGNVDHLTRTERGTINPKELRNISGERGEIRGLHRNKSGQKWEDFKKDIKERGVIDPIHMVVDPKKGVRITEGNHRLDAALELGLDKIPFTRSSFGRADEDFLNLDGTIKRLREKNSLDYLPKEWLRKKNTLKKNHHVDENLRQAQHPKLKKAAEDLDEGSITVQEYREVADIYSPTKLIREIPEIPSAERIEALVSGNKAEKKIIGVNKLLTDGLRVSNRLDIPTYNIYDTWVVTYHHPGKAGKPGPVIGYGKTSYLTDVDFHLPTDKQPQTKGLGVAKGKSKTPYAAMEGNYKKHTQEEVTEIAQEAITNPQNSEWVQVGMNPYRRSYFYDKNTMEPLLEAEEVIQIGPLLLAKGVKYGDSLDFKIFKSGGRVEKNPYNYEPRAI